MATLCDEDVCGLDVAVHDALRMGGIQSVGDLDAHVEKLLQVHGAVADAVLQRGALEKLHGNEHLPGALADLINRADVRVIQRRRGASLTTEPFEDVGFAGQFRREEFQCGGAAELSVLGFVHHAHPAAAHLLQDAVVRDGLPDQGVGAFHSAAMVVCGQSGVNESGAVASVAIAATPSTAFFPGVAMPGAFGLCCGVELIAGAALGRLSRSQEREPRRKRGG